MSSATVAPSSFKCNVCPEQVLETITLPLGKLDRCPICNWMLMDRDLLLSYVEEREAFSSSLNETRLLRLPTGRQCPRCLDFLWDGRIRTRQTNLMECPSCRAIWTDFATLRKLDESMEVALRGAFEKALFPEAEPGSAAALPATPFSPSSTAGRGIPDAGMGKWLRGMARSLDQWADRVGSPKAEGKLPPSGPSASINTSSPAALPKEKKEPAPPKRPVGTPKIVMPQEPKTKPSPTPVKAYTPPLIKESETPAAPGSAPKVAPPPAVEEPAPVVIEEAPPLIPTILLPTPDPLTSVSPEPPAPSVPERPLIHEPARTAESSSLPSPLFAPPVEEAPAPPAAPALPDPVMAAESIPDNPAQGRPSIEMSFEARVMPPEPESPPIPPLTTELPPAQAPSLFDALSSSLATPVPKTEVLEAVKIEAPPPEPAPSKPMPPNETAKPLEPLKPAPPAVVVKAMPPAPLKKAKTPKTTGLKEPQVHSVWGSRVIAALPWVFPALGILWNVMSEDGFIFEVALGWIALGWGMGRAVQLWKLYPRTPFEAMTLSALLQRAASQRVEGLPVTLKGDIQTPNAVRPGEAEMFEGDRSIALERPRVMELLRKFFGASRLQRFAGQSATISGWIRHKGAEVSLEIQEIVSEKISQRSMARALRWASVAVCVLVGILLLLTSD